MFKRTFVQLLAALFLVSAVGAMTGCNTIEGAGQDIQKGGKAVSEEAREHK